MLNYLSEVLVIFDMNRMKKKNNSIPPNISINGSCSNKLSCTSANNNKVSRRIKIITKSIK